MSGIHIHPHDILDEGPSAIMERVGRMDGVRYLLPEMNTIFERNPYPSGVLPHNPVHPVVMGTGTFHVPMRTRELYPRLYQKEDATLSEGADSLAVLLEAVKGTSYEVVPWVNLLNGHFKGDVEANGVFDFRGRPVDHWLCPNGPDVVGMWTEVLAATSERYGCTTFLLDRIRYPDWAGKTVNPSGIFSCFCDRCRAKMDNQGINTDLLQLDMVLIASLLSAKQFDQAVDVMTTSETMQAWVRFKQDNVSEFIEKLTASLAELNPSIVCWLDLWPPSYAWLLGQDYTRLTRVSPALKHFPYHKLGGGADVQGLIRYFASTLEEQEHAFRAFQRLFGMSYPITYEQFVRQGFPIEFVGIENDKVRRQSQPGTYIFSGIQMWNLSTEELTQAIGEARRSAADDLLYYCYGWAGEELFDAAGASSARERR
ncbi:MAG: hypothetical protein K0Q94_3038 [Paenibacillus sp.]|jgi:hypothetical protein|nr:hypothetical protein [Paenibacillus sp.]